MLFLIDLTLKPVGVGRVSIISARNKQQTLFHFVWFFANMIGMLMFCLLTTSNVKQDLRVAFL